MDCADLVDESRLGDVRTILADEPERQAQGYAAHPPGLQKGNAGQVVLRVSGPVLACQDLAHLCLVGLGIERNVGDLLAAQGPVADPYGHKREQQLNDAGQQETPERAIERKCLDQPRIQDHQHRRQHQRQ